MNEYEARENYLICSNCEYCSSASFHTSIPYIHIGCAKAGRWLYDDDKCPLGKWEYTDD